MTAPAWEQIQIERHEDGWAPFDARFAFRPYSWRSGEPAINEPTPSLTIDLAPLLTSWLPVKRARP